MLQSLLKYTAPRWYFHSTRGEDKVFVPIILVLLFITLVFVVIYFFYCLLVDPSNNVKHLSNAAGVLLVAGGAFWIRHTRKSLNLPLSTIQLLGFGFTCLSIYDTGGIYSVDFLWMILMTVISSLLVTNLVGPLLCVLTIGATVVFYGLEQQGNVDFLARSGRWQGLHELFTIPFLVIFLTSCLVVYRRLLARIRTQLEQTQKQRITELDRRVNALSAEMEGLRRSLAQDFHDEFGNKLAGLSMLALRLERHLPSKDSDVQQIVNRIEELSREIYQSGKDFIWSMRDMELGVSDFFRYITSFGNDLFEHAPTQLIVQQSASQDRLVPHTFDLALLLKEALTNAYKHADATKVYFTCREQAGRLFFQVNDNGKGFDPDGFDVGMGLPSMRHRAAKIGADFQLKSTKKGTQIDVVLSL